MGWYRHKWRSWEDNNYLDGSGENITITSPGRQMGPRQPPCWRVLCLRLCSPRARGQRGDRQLVASHHSQLGCFLTRSIIIGSLLLWSGEDTNRRRDRDCRHQRVLLQAHPQPRHRPDQVIGHHCNVLSIILTNFCSQMHRCFPHWRLPSLVPSNPRCQSPKVIFDVYQSRLYINHSRWSLMIRELDLTFWMLQDLQHPL